MDNEVILLMVKSNIQMASNAFDEYLIALIATAKELIAEHGIVLNDESIADMNLVTMYASYLWSKRQSESPAMPRMLQYAINNRLFSQKMGGDA